MDICEKLLKIQLDLKAPKSQFNKFGNYNYRSTEDILEALKPLFSKYKAFVMISDEIQLVGERYYVKATARLVDAESSDNYIEVSAYAREAHEQRGMSDSQITGSASSYARKYALNGLFAIDDTKDDDFMNKGDSTNSNPRPLTDKQLGRLYAIANSVGVKKEKVDHQVRTRFKKEVKNLSRQEYDTVCQGYENMKGN